MKRVQSTAFLLALTFLAPIAQAQTEPSSSDLVIRVETKRVVLDLMVFDTDGNFITDLKPEDFEVFEEGQLRPVSNLVLIDKSTFRGRSLSELPLQEREYYEDRLVVVLDRVSVDASQFNQTLRALEELTKSLPDHTEIALFLFDGRLRMIQGFTRDPVELKSAAQRISRALPIRRVPTSFEISEEISSLFTERLALGFRITDTTAMQDIIADTVTDAIRVANQHLRLVEVQLNDFFSNMNRMVRSLRHVDGAKSVVLFSHGYSLLQGDGLREIIRDNIEGRVGIPGGAFETKLVAQSKQVDIIDYHSEMSRLIGTANRNGIRLYTVDPAGLQTMAPGGDASRSSQFFLMLNHPERKFFRDLRGLAKPVDSLVTMAQETNALAFYNKNDLSRAIPTILDHNSRYYLLGYEPVEDRREDRFYRVKVKVKKPGKYRVFSEKGYLYQDDATTSMDELRYALAYPGLFRQIPFDASAATFYKSQQPITTISLEIPSAAMPFRFESDRYVSELNILGFFLDDQGQEQDRFTLPYRVELAEDEFSQYDGKSFIFYEEKELPPGKYEFRAIIQDRETGLIGADMIELKVAPRKNKLAVSDVVFSQDVRPVTEHRDSPLFFDNFRMVPEGNRSVRLEDPLFVFFQVYNLKMQGSAPDGSVRFQVSDAHDSLVYRSDSIPLEYTQSRGVEVTHTFPLWELSLGEGLYNLQVQIDDHKSGQTLSQSFDFHIQGRRPR